MWSKTSNDTTESLKRDVLNDCSSLLNNPPDLHVESAWSEFEKISLGNKNKICLYLTIAHLQLQSKAKMAHGATIEQSKNKLTKK